MPVAFLLGPVSHLMPITQLDQQPSKLRDHTQYYWHFGIFDSNYPVIRFLQEVDQD